MSHKKKVNEKGLFYKGFEQNHATNKITVTLTFW